MPPLSPTFIIISVCALLVVAAVGVFAGYLFRKNIAEKEIGSAEDEATRILNEAIKSAESKKREAVVEAREEIYRVRTENERELKERRAEVQKQERRIQQKEESLEKKHENIDRKEEKLTQKLKEIEEKHYRLWKLANRDKTLSMPTISLEELKAEFPDDEPIQSCNSLDEVYSVAGNPVGIGGSMFFLDNLIYLVCRWNDIDVVKPYSGSSYGTRIYNVDSLLENLEMGCPIPLRVENSVYLNDSSLKGGHYITLYGFNSGTAIVVDSNIDSNAGIKELPIKQLFDAMIANPNLVCAWNPSTVLLRK